MVEEKQSLPRMGAKRVLLLAIIALLYLLMFDWWNWDDRNVLWGFPRFLIFLFTVQLFLTVSMFLLARFGWPKQPADLSGRRGDTQ